jgi:hypothetical protein
MVLTYLNEGTTEPATFSLFSRKLPADRGFWPPPGWRTRSTTSNASAWTTATWRSYLGRTQPAPGHGPVASPGVGMPRLAQEPVQASSEKCPRRHPAARAVAVAQQQRVEAEGAVGDLGVDDPLLHDGEPLLLDEEGAGVAEIGTVIRSGQVRHGEASLEESA